MQPFKHYESELIQDTIIESPMNSCSADESTIQRWKKSFQLAKAQIETILIACWIYLNRRQYPILEHNSLLETIQKTIPHWLAFVMRMLINSGNKIYTQFAFCP